MRHFITVEKRAGKWACIAGPNGDYEAQNAAFKAAVVAKPDDREEIQIWSSSNGIVKRARVGNDNAKKINPGIKWDADKSAPAAPAAPVKLKGKPAK